MGAHNSLGLFDESRDPALSFLGSFRLKRQGNFLCNNLELSPASVLLNNMGTVPSLMRFVRLRTQIDSSCDRFTYPPILKVRPCPCDLINLLEVEHSRNIESPQHLRPLVKDALLDDILNIDSQLWNALLILSFDSNKRVLAHLSSPALVQALLFHSCLIYSIRRFNMTY